VRSRRSAGAMEAESTCLPPSQSDLPNLISRIGTPKWTHAIARSPKAVAFSCDPSPPAMSGRTLSQTR